MRAGQQLGSAEAMRERGLRLALVGSTTARRRGVLLLQLLREYRADVTAPLVAENARLRAELARVQNGRR